MRGALFIFYREEIVKMLGERLKKERAKMGLTQNQVADLLGVERSSYTKYKCGSSKPSIGVLYKISLVYEVAIEELIRLAM